jgi:hypothetical protein
MNQTQKLTLDRMLKNYMMTTNENERLQEDLKVWDYINSDKTNENDRNTMSGYYLRQRIQYGRVDFNVQKLNSHSSEKN